MFRAVVAWVVASAANDVLRPLPPPLSVCGAGAVVPAAAAAFRLRVILAVGVAGVEAGVAAVG